MVEKGLPTTEEDGRGQKLIETLQKGIIAMEIDVDPQWDWELGSGNHRSMNNVIF